MVSKKNILFLQNPNLFPRVLQQVFQKPAFAHVDYGDVGCQLYQGLVANGGGLLG
jgi:hypothetical protein